MKFIYLFLVIICALSPVPAQKPADAFKSDIINGEKLLRDLQTLSADDMAGRGIGTVGGAKAREYIADAFKSAGIKPFNNSYFQPFEVVFQYEIDMLPN